MTPKDKALELHNNYWMTIPLKASNNKQESIELATKCALIAIDEIMSFVPYENYKDTINLYDGAELSMSYWKEVRTEIEKL